MFERDPMALREKDQLTDQITHYLTRIISDTNGVTVNDTLNLLLNSKELIQNQRIHSLFKEFHQKLLRYQPGQSDINQLLEHPVSKGFYQYFKNFPLRYQDDHIHLTGSLTADFIYKHLKQMLSS